MGKLLAFVVASALLSMLLNTRGGEYCIRDKDDLRKLTLRFRAIVRWIALFGSFGMLFLFYKVVPEYLADDPVNWGAIAVYVGVVLVFIWFFIYVSLTRVIIWEDDRIIQQFPFWRKEIRFQDVKELIWTIDRGGGHYEIRGSRKKITVHPMYVDYFRVQAVVQRNCKHAKKRKINKV